jgi:hypothetical protein
VLRPGKAVYRIRVTRGDTTTVEVDGKTSAGNSFGIEAEGEFDVKVTVAGVRAAVARTRKGQRANAAE